MGRKGCPDHPSAGRFHLEHGWFRCGHTGKADAAHGSGEGKCLTTWR